jgi:Lhr-like helicase
MFDYIFKIYNKRNEQLKFQQEQDEILKKNFNKCPNNIFKLLMLERKMNRQQAELYKNFSIISLFDNMENELIKIDEYQCELAKLLTTKNVCINLDKFINKYKET